MVGHSALRRFVLGADFQRESRPDELEELERLLDDSIRAGAFGLSTSRSSTHIDGDGDPVPSRWASEEEAMVFVAGRGASRWNVARGNDSGMHRRLYRG